MLALMAAFGPAHADDAVDALIKPDTASISVGVAGTTGSREDRSILGQYNGWGDTKSAVQLDFEYVQRNDETGTWTKAEGRNLGLDNRELQFSREDRRRVQRTEPSRSVDTQYRDARHRHNKPNGEPRWIGRWG